MARISYVDPATLADPELVSDLDRARRYGTPRALHGAEVPVRGEPLDGDDAMCGGLFNAHQTRRDGASIGEHEAPPHWPRPQP